MLVIKAFISSVRELQTNLSGFTSTFKHIDGDGKFPISHRTPVFFWRHQSKINHGFNSNQSIFTELNTIESVNSLIKNGFSLGIILHQDIVREIVSSTRNLPCYGNQKIDKSFYFWKKEEAQTKYGEVFANAVYDDAALLSLVIQNIESDPKLLEIATKYLGTNSIHKRHKLWWNFAEESNLYERRQAAQMFDDNLNRCRGVTFFFYLTDVNLCSSPHVCVRGSHVKKKLSHLFLRRGFTYQQITQYYGYQNIVPICGKAGFGFVTDTRCLQKANPPGSKDRLMLEIEFSVRDKRVNRGY